MYLQLPVLCGIYNNGSRKCNLCTYSCRCCVGYIIMAVESVIYVLTVAGAVWDI